jgi:hypothetical protein
MNEAGRQELIFILQILVVGWLVGLILGLGPAAYLPPSIARTGALGRIATKLHRDLHCTSI